MPLDTRFNLRTTLTNSILVYEIGANFFDGYFYDHARILVAAGKESSIANAITTLQKETSASAVVGKTYALLLVDKFNKFINDNPKLEAIPYTQFKKLMNEFCYECSIPASVKSYFMDATHQAMFSVDKECVQHLRAIHTLRHPKNNEPFGDEVDNDDVNMETPLLK